MGASEKIAVLGLGYVGCVSAACLAKLGHHVIGCDISRHKVEAIRNKVAPFFEPGLTDVLDEVVSAGRLDGQLKCRHIDRGQDHAAIGIT